MVERFNACWKDKTIYEKAKGSFFIQVQRHVESDTYYVMVDSLWKDSWQLPCYDIHGRLMTKDVGNPKIYNLQAEEFHKMFEALPQRPNDDRIL